MVERIIDSFCVAHLLQCLYVNLGPLQSSNSAGTDTGTQTDEGTDWGGGSGNYPDQISGWKQTDR